MTRRLPAGPALLACLCALGAATPDLPEIGARLELVIRDATPRAAAGEKLHPGDLVALKLEWTGAARPAAPALTPPGKTAEPGKVLPRRLVAGDPRAAGADTVEVLLAALGKTEIPALVITDGQGKPVARTRPVALEVHPALPEGESQPAPARPAIWISPELAGILVLIGALLALLAASLYLVWRAWKRRRRGGPAGTEEPPRDPADLCALCDLDLLLAEGLIEQGRIKEFCVRLAEIGKAFLGTLSGLPLLERTTRECVRALSRSSLPRERTRWLGPWLDQIDLVKFAKHRPAPDELARLASDLRGVILAAAAERQAAAAAGPAAEDRP